MDWERIKAMRPLEGIKVLDFTQAHAGSLSTMLLADFGAEIIKIERAGIGDLARYWEPLKEDCSGYYAFLNRNKSSISLNAFSEEGRQILYKLVKEVDVVCENFKYGSMQRMGLDYDTLKQINPGIIYASLNGFGQTGTMKNAIGLDLQLQAMSGLMDRTGFPDGPPTRVGAAFGDHLSGTYMAMAINLALINKKKTGIGQRIDIAILDSLCSVLEDSPVTQSLKGEIHERTGNRYLSLAPYDTFKTKDGYLSVAVSTDKQWQSFCLALDLDDLANDRIYRTNEGRVDNYDKGLKRILAQRFINLSKVEAEARLLAAGIPCARVYSVKEAMASEQILEREMLIEVDDKAVGKIKFPGIAIKMSKTPGRVVRTAPRLGEQTRKYLSELGLSPIQINDLIKSKVVEAPLEGVIG